ncbi:threonine--tRNA ligase [Candidatus Kaiserbacteria bacterium RIFCSPLOWO2_01_FULL_54_20]|uniref:Threonine--tRNA ligase n=1 Tax=Candidatus Kaiserbacteria bacterium RIFCSPLOWO2_01_FULL_54_20 TaxID=1798513 RepID=A0A1F6EKI8_9BACT|nr:MAG: threonine--tRNA ligase [Candidatus Kaiserbacteria bacterium RIFCSPLOWO2_01_FULL_54_20]
MEGLEHVRHTLAHLLAAAVRELYPSAKNAIGPSIENGFYQDFDLGEHKVSEEDFPKIEERMRKILKTWTSASNREVTPAEAKKEFEWNEYKCELIDEFAEGGKTLTFYTLGDFLDLCKGGHSENPEKEVNLEAFKLDRVAGAYWRGDSKNKMLTRIYGLAFEDKKELDAYIKQREEAMARDHKVLGPKHELFMFHHTAPGMPYWLPKGVVLYNELVQFWREEHAKRGYQEIVSPLLNKKELYETSGHYEHYWADMFTVKSEDEEYGVKAMNCPNAMVVFGSKGRSYRDLPLRLSDTDTLHRNELSGTLNGLLRVREFRQDDAHIFVEEDEIGAEYKRVFEIVERFYSIFGMHYTFRLGTRPESFMGEVETWDKAEATLKTILEESGKEHVVLEGDGAFYGPKVDILMNDVLGREWQMGTIQLDFQQPQRFKLEYTAKDGSKKTPVAIHRVIYGSMERFIGILIEHYAAAFPLWLAPIQARVLPIGEAHQDFSRTVLEKLKEAGIRAELDDSNESLGKKIRAAKTEKVPYLLVIGDAEVAAKQATLEGRNGKVGALSVSDIIQKLTEEITSRG